VGILGTAAIASKTRRAIVAAGHVVAAIASRDAARAAAWAAAAVASGDVPAPAPAAFGSYAALLAAPGVDAVYVPLPTGARLEWVLAAAAAGKHVLVEKPAASSVAELEAMVAACRAAGVAFLDGTMFHFHPRQDAMEAAARDAAFGPVARVATAFSFRGDADFFANNIRTSAALERFGALGDLGQYNIRFGLSLFDWELPSRVRAVAHVRNAARVPMDVSATFSWPAGGPDGGARALLVDCAFTAAFRQWAEVVGTRAVLRVEDFVIPRSHAACDFSVTREPGLDAAHSGVVGATEVVASGGNQEAAMWRAFAARAAPGGGGFCGAWAARALKVQACLDAALASADAEGAAVDVVAPAGLAGLE